MSKSLKRVAPMCMIAAYATLGIFLIRFYRYEIDPDGISYISIAQKYARGEFSDAINACWGPLYSWLLVPFLSLGIDPLLAAKILGIILGTVTLAGFIRLTDRFEIHDPIRKLLQVTSIPILLSYSFTLITADLLQVCIIIFYCCVIFDADYSARSFFSGFACGILGALAYFAKSYGLPFFCIHFSIMNGIYFIKSPDPVRKARLVKNWLSGIAVFLAVSSIWIAVISQKYGYVTFGTAGRYNFARIGPGEKGDTGHLKGQAMIYDGFLDLPNRTALNSFEDPSLYDRKLWNPVRHYRHYASVVYMNMREAARVFLKFSPFSIPVLIISFFVCLGPLRRSSSVSGLGILLLTTGVFTLGYLLVVIEERYLWIDSFFLLCMGGILLRLLRSSRVLGTSFRFWTVAAAVMLSFLAAPLKDLASNFNSGKDIRVFGIQLKDRYGIKGFIASSRHWNLNYYLAYYLKTQYYGASNNLYDCGRLERELAGKHVDYYLAWDDSEELQCAFLKNMPQDKRVFQDVVILERIPHTVTIYDLRAERKE